MVGVAGAGALVTSVVNGAGEDTTPGTGMVSGHCYLGGLKGAQYYGGVESRCRMCGVYCFVGITVGALYSASYASSFSNIQTWHHPGHAFQTPGSVGKRYSGRVQGATSEGCVQKNHSYSSGRDLVCKLGRVSPR